MNGSRTVLKTATWLVLWLSLWAAPSASAQDDPAPDSELSAADVTLRLELLADDGELSAELPDDLRSKLRGLWSAVLEQLQALDVAQGNLDRWEEGRLAAAEAVLSQQQRAAAEVPAVGPQIPEDGELLDLETGLSAARYEQAELDLAREAIVAEQARRVERGRQIPGELAAVQQNLVALDVLEEPAGAAAELREARDALTRVSRQAGRLQFDAVSAERPYYDAEENLISLQLDGATRRRDVAVVAVLAWESALRDARKRASALAEAEARQEVEKVVDQPPLVRDLAGETEQHAVRRNEITELHAHAAEVLDALVQAQSRIDELSLASKEKIKVAGISNAVAVLLRKQRSELPEILSVVERQAELPQSSIEVELEVIDRRRDRATLGQRRETSVSEILRALDEVARVDGVAPLRGAERLELEGVIRGLLQSQHEGLSPLIVELNRYFTDLNAIEFARETLSATVDDYGRFIDEHILWVRSAPAVAFSDLSRAAKGFGTLLLPSIWATAGEALKGQLARRTVQVAWAGLLIVLLALMRPLARRQIRRVGEKLSPRKLAPIVPTVVVLLLTLVCASLWPVLLWMAGWLLSWPGSLPVVASVGLGLMRLAPVLVPMVFLGEVCRPMGLAEAHLRWSNEVVRSVRRYLWMWNVFVVPALGLALIFDGPGLAQYESAAGRFSLMFSLAGMAVVGYRITRSQGPVMRALRSGAGSLLFTRLQWVWFPITGLLPGALVVAVALGFQYGSLQVALGLIHSATLIFPLLVVRGVVRRWLSLARLRLALEQLQRRREAEAEEAGSEPEVSGEIRALADEPDERDVGQIDEQAMRLVDVTLLVALSLGLMVIWADLLPALGGLRRVELWQSKVTSALADGSVSTQLVAVSLADVLGALLLAGLTVLATGNLPGLLEMTVLRRMTLEPGGGYAITTICRYLLTAGGVIGVASLLGITWDSVQWLAAAVSVGLGFGLQEIFANFVSGLIILFERPIRVGDIITVGGIEGVVTRIRTRATTIRDRDRRELLVPNKEFITGQLVNWTLSDPISRLILPVGIAYGSDTALAERTLIEVASAHPMVLESPIPNVVFRNFGDSTLDYELRVFIADRDFWPNVTHELNTAIHQSFAERGLEIAFPQRDLHLRDGAGEILGDWAAARRAVAAGVGQADESKEPNTD